MPVASQQGLQTYSIAVQKKTAIVLLMHQWPKVWAFGNNKTRFCS